MSNRSTKTWLFHGVFLNFDHLINLMDYAVLFHISAGILLYTSLHSLAGEEPTCFRNNSHHGSYSEWCLIFSQVISHAFLPSVKAVPFLAPLFFNFQ